VLLGLAAALAASLVFAMIVAEHRDYDGRGVTGAATERVVAPSAVAGTDGPVERLATLRLTARR
jgi:hypothetical protein